jgi:eukaryotic-like serine/threonine-protein kinase
VTAPQPDWGYEIIRELGRGTSGVVYLARHPRIDRQVALKTLHPHPSCEQQQRFMREARAMACVGHPHIVELYEVRQAGEQLFYCREFVDGTTLERLIFDRPLACAEALRIIAGLADAFVAVHAHGVVHRNLARSNVLVDKVGAPKLIGFGRAKAYEAQAETDIDVRALEAILCEIATATDKPSGLDAIAARCRGKVPRRYTSAKELANDLRGLSA